MPVAFADAPRLTTVILVRHAEKAGGEAAAAMTADPPLSEAGTARANELARVLAGTKVDAIYTTQYARTKLTAGPAGTAVKIAPQVFEADRDYASKIAAKIRNDHRGHTVVVVGHSNTTVSVMKELGVAAPPAIPDSQYDDLFVVTFIDGAAPSVVALRYGAATR
jgi:broad specificity phosphatase PhoE